MRSANVVHDPQVCSLSTSWSNGISPPSEQVFPQPPHQPAIGSMPMLAAALAAADQAGSGWIWLDLAPARG
jgi:hypothetical protein